MAKIWWEGAQKHFKGPGLVGRRANVTGTKLYLVNNSRGSAYTVMLTLKIRNLEWWRTGLGLPAIHRDQKPHSAVLEFF